MDGEGERGMMSGEKLRHAIVLQTNTPTKATDGSETPSWADTATVRASKEHQASRKFFAAQKVNAECTDIFTIRYRSDVTTNMRVKFGTRYYDIIGAPDPDGMRRELQLLCKEVT